MMTRNALLALSLSLGLFATAIPSAVLAQDTPSAEAQPEGVSPESDRAQSFRAMTGPATEDVPGGTLLIGAYGLVWFFLLLLVLRIWSVSRGVAGELARLESALADAEES